MKRISLRIPDELYGQLLRHVTDEKIKRTRIRFIDDEKNEHITAYSLNQFAIDVLKNALK